MDRRSDGADSAEDSGSSQPYPSTLPGIPEGSARQLFQRLQGPMEENALKSHFEKIIMVWQKQHYRKAKKDNHDPKQLQQPHGSHALALSQVSPNNLSGGPVLTPLDLCEAISSSPDFVPVGYQGPHSGGLPIPNHGNVAPMIPGSSSGSSLPGSSTMVHGSHLASASAPRSPSVRDGRYGIPRGGSLSIDEQHRMQQFNQMSARNIQQSSLPPGSHSGPDRGVRMLPGGTAMGVVNGMNRNMAMARPGFQGAPSPSMLNSGVSPANMHSGAGPAQGNSMRPREALHMTRPNQNTDHQRQVMAPDLQMQQQVSQGGTTQGVPAFPSGMAMGSFPNQNAQPSVQAYPHPISPQQSPHMPNNNSHPAFGMRFLKDRQLHQQRLLQQQFATSNAMMPHGQPQPQQSQLPVSFLQSSSPIGTPSMNPMKHPVPAPPPHGVVRNPQTGVNHPVKQQPRQPHQPQQTVKVMKGGGRGTINQNIPAGPSFPNGFSGSQSGLTKRNPGQPQPPPVAPSSYHRQPQPQPPPKLMSQTQSTSGQRVVQSRKANSSDLTTSSSETPVAGGQKWKKSESFNDSSGGVSDTATKSGKVKVLTGMSRSPPQSNSAETGGEHSGPAVNHGGENSGPAVNHGEHSGSAVNYDGVHSGPAVNSGVVQKQSGSDSLTNSVGCDAGVQWQQEPLS